MAVLNLSMLSRLLGMFFPETEGWGRFSDMEIYR
jgi:hypothetical protein